MKIKDNAKAAGPFVLLVDPGGNRDCFVVCETISDTFINKHAEPFETKERALEVATQYEGEIEGDNTGEITVLSLRDAASLKRFMSW